MDAGLVVNPNSLDHAVSAPKIAALANCDTPSAVEVPSTWAGLIVWAAGRFGVGIVFAVVFGYAVREVYNDSKSQRDQLMKYVVERNDIDAKRAIADTELAKSIAQLAESVENLCDEAKRAHAVVMPKKMP